MTDRPRLLMIAEPGPGMAERLSRHFDVTRLSEIEDCAAFLATEGPAFQIASTSGHADTDVLDALPNLKLLASFGVGYDGIDAGALAARGVVVTHTPGVLDDEVADTALLLWMAVSRQLVAAHAHAESGDWVERGAYPLTRGIRGRRVGILGLGRIGQTIAQTAEFFGAEVFYTARSEKDVAWAFVADPVDLARRVEALFVITPLTDETHHLVDRKMLDALGPEGILVNIARGPVVDEAALVAAIEDGRLGGAGLDVFEHEPEVPEGLKGRANVVLAPHIGSATVETRQAMGALVCENIEAFAEDGSVVTPVPEARGIARVRGA